MDPIRVLLVDDHPEFLSEAANFLRQDPMLEVVDCLLSSKKAIAKIPALRPDVVLMTLVMDEMNGLVATLHMKSMPHSPKVIMVTDYDEPIYQAFAKAIHVDASVSKRAFCNVVLAMIRKLCAPATAAI
jgi:DNA-binding NarL/FixJ family response regulator